MPSVRTVLAACVIACLPSAPNTWSQAQKAATLSSLPYSGTIWTTTTAPGADGTPVIETHRLIVAQSSAGAVRRDSFANTPGVKHDLTAKAGMIILHDTAKQQTAILDPQTHIAEVRSIQSIVKPATAQTKVVSSATRNMETLGSSIVSGLPVVGTRRTYTVAAPPGASSSTAVVTEDTWISPMLHAVIKSEAHDTLGLQRINHGEHSTG